MSYAVKPLAYQLQYARVFKTLTYYNVTKKAEHCIKTEFF